MSKISEQTAAAIFAAIAGAIASAIISRILPETISLNYWWFVGAVGLIIALVLFIVLQQRSRNSIFKKYRVTNVRDGKGLWPSSEPAFEGRAASDGAWSFKAAKVGAYPIHGPELRDPLAPGKYRATYRLQVNGVNVKDANRYVVRPEVLAKIVEGGTTKALASRSLTTYDFDEKDKFKDFNLDFEVLARRGELRLEMCIQSSSSGIKVTFDYVELSRR